MTGHARRSAVVGRRLHPTVVIGAALVALTVAALSLVQTHDPAERTAPPQETTLTAASVGCPAGLGDAGGIKVATGTPGLEGEVTVTGGERPKQLPITSGEVSGQGRVPQPVSVTARGELASGLLAARFGDQQLAAVDCPPPDPDLWFTGVGAGARHHSVVELVNPDEGSALADITVFGRGGQIEVTQLRGIAVGGHDSVRLDLAELIPRRSELALHVVVTRGRLSATVLDQLPKLGSRPFTEDFLSSQGEPASETVLLGLAPGEGKHVLAVANPGDDEARVTVKVIAEDSAFVPEGVDELRVPAGSLKSMKLTSVLRQAIKDGALGLKITSTVPVTSTLRSRVEDDLVHAVPVPASGTPMTLLVPDGTAEVVIADAGGVGVATVRSWTAGGKELDEKSLELQPGQGGVIKLPRGADLVRIEPERTTLHAAVLVTGRDGAAVLGFHELLTDARIPAVRPGLP